eukprot:1048219-Amphidinium_carterae.1
MPGAVTVVKRMGPSPAIPMICLDGNRLADEWANVNHFVFLDEHLQAKLTVLCLSAGMLSTGGTLYSLSV